MNIYINYLAFGAFASSVFLLILGLNIFRIPNKSKSTTHLAFMFLWQALMNGSYILTFVMNNPFGAYHRWGTVFAILPGLIH